MMYDMIVNGAMEKVASDEPEVPVNGTGSTSNKGPSLGGIEWQGGIVMVEKCYRN